MACGPPRCRDPAKRLGAGQKGYDELKAGWDGSGPGFLIETPFGG